MVVAAARKVGGYLHVMQAQIFEYLSPHKQTEQIVYLSF